MGNWALEIGKMALYMSFPVAIFHYFNQPEYFEEWVTSTRRELYPPVNPDYQRQIEKVQQELEAKHEREMLDELKRQNRNI